MPPIVPFGKEFKEKYFTGFNKDVHNLNHGAFGATTPALLENKFNHAKKIMEFPDEFFRYDIFDANKRCRQLVSKVVNCDDNNLVLVSNATTAVNSVLRSYPFKRGDIIICFATVYGSCYNTLKFLKKYVGIEIIKIDYVYPISHLEIVEKFKHVVDSCPQIPRMAFFDAVSSTPSALFPWQNIVKLCHEYGILSFVDAAHYIGLLPLDLSFDKPDFFTSNLHKWFFVPNSCAFLYVDPKHHKEVHSLPISAKYFEDELENSLPNYSNLVTSSSSSGKTEKISALVDQFNYVSTLDYTSMLTIPDAVKFRNEVCGGEDAIMTYNLNLAKEAAEYLLANWKDSKLLTGGKDQISTAMFNIKIPKYSEKNGYSTEELVKIATFLNDYLRLKKRTFVPVFIYRCEIWTRWSAQIYLDLDDFKWGLEAFKEAILAYECQHK